MNFELLELINTAIEEPFKPKNSCSKHPGEVLNFYCLEERALLCQHCVKPHLVNHCEIFDSQPFLTGQKVETIINQQLTSIENTCDQLETKLASNVAQLISYEEKFQQIQSVLMSTISRLASDFCAQNIEQHTLAIQVGTQQKDTLLCLHAELKEAQLTMQHPKLPIASEARLDEIGAQEARIESTVQEIHEGMVFT